ncbi:hypothetical protein J416_15087 [Gracilibacillus halophilus YIM-C55.5]|uniref:DUF1611 domain-containing protein n=1 Tax=Gracilibacillus halophilus YIM-C55.5 TaxID=1308866 RepID=N4W603_9BACI|nr:hypothetical protein [Gracilibacillus halophilus]ENH95633.1 hypothetical protein J416_15087 [Gracilibacillus halophilus YIM-C55.5]
MTKLLDYESKVFASNTRFKFNEIENIGIVGGRGKIGDIILLRSITSNGVYDTVEDINGRHVKIYKGDCFVGVLGNRESSKLLLGGIPEKGLDITEGTRLHLLTDGGIVGQIVYTPDYLEKPMELECIGLLKKDNVILNTLEINGKKSSKLNNIVPIILTTATGTSAGKTTLTSKIINQLSKDYNIAALKLAGTGCLEDILRLKDAGAKWTMDFPDVGLPSTYVHKDIYLPRIRYLINKISEYTPDFIIAELGGDLLWANIPSILQDKMIMNNVSSILLVPLDSVGAIGSDYLLKKWNVNCDLFIINSPFQNSQSSKRRVKKYLDRVSYDMNKDDDLHIVIDNLTKSISTFNTNSNINQKGE